MHWVFETPIDPDMPTITHHASGYEFTESSGFTLRDQSEDLPDSEDELDDDELNDEVLDLEDDEEIDEDDLNDEEEDDSVEDAQRARKPTK
jgi:hypothetical protein